MNRIIQLSQDDLAATLGLITPKTLAEVARYLIAESEKPKGIIFFGATPPGSLLEFYASVYSNPHFQRSDDNL